VRHLATRLENGAAHANVNVCWNVHRASSGAQTSNGKKKQKAAIFRKAGYQWIE
jgi:hypothetical protein